MHFHIGASQTSLSYFGTTFWPSQDDYVKPAIGGASLFQNNSRVLLNSAYSGMFDRHPDLKMVSVESGIGWIPFMLEAMDYELEENAPEHAKKLQKLPSEYFRDNWYATFWFENGRGDLQQLIDNVGEDNIMFETDFPHPTCLYPSPLAAVEEKIARAPARDPAQGDGRQRRRPVPASTTEPSAPDRSGDPRHHDLARCRDEDVEPRCATPRASSASPSTSSASRSSAERRSSSRCRARPMRRTTTSRAVSESSGVERLTADPGADHVESSC